MPEKSLAVFEGKRIRRHYDEDTGTWFFSVVDIVQVLIQQPDYQAARKYWNKLKERLKKEGSESVTKCHRLKLEAKERLAAEGSQLVTKCNRLKIMAAGGGMRSAATVSRQKRRHHCQEGAAGTGEQDRQEDGDR